MSTTDAPAPNGTAAKKPANAKKEIKILMLHGFTQSGNLFRFKTRALEKLMAKSLAPFNILPVLTYPTGPNRLSPRDVPGYEQENAEADDSAELDAWSWWRKDDPSGSYRHLDLGVRAAAAAIREAGGDVDGVLGFSQGGAFAALLTAMLELPHREVPEDFKPWVEELREANGGKPLRFAVVYSGFFATPEELKWAYEPKIRTPSLHMIGSLDTVVEESRSQGLVERFEDPTVVVHPGGHYVPIAKQWAMPLIGFIKKAADQKAAEESVAEDKAPESKV
ncbi:dihydrofolate reductase [Colletotrichum sojae]|uniref:Dihydrofolate reductase n=1 Tax=Colletotrichum sojae TaxID=2175907 RepID=A0A8H6IS27_9PEZI|nr:dihydrofolate reductase [Colletotrichum sojae]